jgi:hypothetical protein
MHKNLTACPKLSTSLEQAVTTCNNLVGIIRFVARLFQQVRYSDDMTRMLQGWRHKVVTILLHAPGLYWTCWNNLATNLIISTRLLQVVNSLLQTCWQLGTSSANTTCWRLVGRLATRCEIFTRVRPMKVYAYLRFCQRQSPHKLTPRHIAQTQSMNDFASQFALTVYLTDNSMVSFSCTSKKYVSLM